MKPECKLIGENGNVFNLIGIVRRTLKVNGLHDQLLKFDEDFAQLRAQGGGYHDVLNLFDQYVTVI